MPASPKNHIYLWDEEKNKSFYVNKEPMSRRYKTGNNHNEKNNVNYNHIGRLDVCHGLFFKSFTDAYGCEYSKIDIIQRIKFDE